MRQGHRRHKGLVALRQKCRLAPKRDLVEGRIDERIAGFDVRAESPSGLDRRHSGALSAQGTTRGVPWFGWLPAEAWAVVWCQCGDGGRFAIAA
jgi:hypothetical protein